MNYHLVFGTIPCCLNLRRFVWRRLNAALKVGRKILKPSQRLEIFQIPNDFPLEVIVLLRLSEQLQVRVDHQLVAFEETVEVGFAALVGRLEQMVHDSEVCFFSRGKELLDESIGLQSVLC